MEDIQSNVEVQVFDWAFEQMIEHQETVQLDYRIDLRRKGRMYKLYQVVAGGLETQIQYNFSLMNTHRNDFKA